jgi:NADH:ubiquinone oxidoreductase subunit K
MSWLDFYLLLFWILFIGFFISFTNVLNLLILGEAFWVLITTYLIFLSSVMDHYFIFFISMYLFVFATSETSVGLALITTKNAFNSSITTNNYFFKNYFFLRKRLTWNVDSKNINLKNKLHFKL